MNKSIYIFILVMLTTQFLDIRPIAEWMADRNGLNGLVSIIIWMIIGVSHYQHRSEHDLCSYGTTTPYFWIMAGIFLSMIPAYMYFDQSFVQSLMTYRVQYFWVMLPLLLYIRPDIENIIHPLNLFSFLFVLTAYIRTRIAPELFLFNETVLERLTYTDYYAEELVHGSGILLLLIPLYYYVNDLREEMTIKNILYVVLYLVAFLILQNRSTLFIVVLVIGYAIIMNKSSNHTSLLLLALIGGMGFYYFTIDTWNALFNETIENLNDKDYNRVMGFYYFIYEANSHMLTYILGNGYLSAHSTSQMQDFMEKGIYNADLGFIGYWNQFGIIPIIVFVTYIIKAIRNEFCPFYVKAIGFHIIACSMTLSYFSFLHNILWFSLFYYLYVYHTENIEYEEDYEEDDGNELYGFPLLNVK
ncbi:MAG: hypothetical protein J6S89_11335 [Paludibacteraceae bacterium]|nr:hypothetical protein [Paludibacteraceae bacterium]